MVQHDGSYQGMASSARGMHSRPALEATMRQTWAHQAVDVRNYRRRQDQTQQPAECNSLRSSKYGSRDSGSGTGPYQIIRRRNQAEKEPILPQKTMKPLRRSARNLLIVPPWSVKIRSSSRVPAIDPSQAEPQILNGAEHFNASRTKGEVCRIADAAATAPWIPGRGGGDKWEQEESGMDGEKHIDAQEGCEEVDSGCIGTAQIPLVDVWGIFIVSILRGQN